MDVQEFVLNYHNYPVLFIGAGLSLRYLENSYSWDDLLRKVALDLYSSEEPYLDIRSRCVKSDHQDNAAIASILEDEFDKILRKDRNGKFEYINEQFYSSAKKGIQTSRFKIYIASLLQKNKYKQEYLTELLELENATKNISSIITTNYDNLIEEKLNFKPLIGNDILLSNPYGSVYKIHGCVTHPDKIIITSNDYEKFYKKYELIRAQLLSLFIHNPIIFIGYSIRDENIKEILKTIFCYLDYNSDEAKQVCNNFLLVEYEKDSQNTDVLEHDIDIEGGATIRIHKLKTDNFSALYRALACLKLPVSAMDIRKVQGVVQRIREGGSIKVSIIEDLDKLENSDMVLAIGSVDTIKYVFSTSTDMIKNYFRIIEDHNLQILRLIDDIKIPSNAYFPIHAFSSICPGLKRSESLKSQLKKKIDELQNNYKEKLPTHCTGYHSSPEAVLTDNGIPASYKVGEIILSIINGNMNSEDVEAYLKSYPDKETTDYRKLICVYDLKFRCQDEKE